MKKVVMVVAVFICACFTDAARLPPKEVPALKWNNYSVEKYLAYLSDGEYDYEVGIRLSDESGNVDRIPVFFVKHKVGLEKDVQGRHITSMQVTNDIFILGTEGNGVFGYDPSTKIVCALRIPASCIFVDFDDSEAPALSPKPINLQFSAPKRT